MRYGPLLQQALSLSPIFFPNVLDVHFIFTVAFVSCTTLALSEALQQKDK